MYRLYKNLNDLYCLANNHLGKLVLLIKNSNSYSFEDLFELENNKELLEKELEIKSKEIDDKKIEYKENKNNLFWGIVSIIGSLLLYLLLLLNFLSSSLIILSFFYLGSMGYIVRLLVKLYKNIKSNNLDELINDKEELIKGIESISMQIAMLKKNIGLKEVEDKQVIDDIINALENKLSNMDIVNDTNITLIRKSEVDK